MAYVDVTNATAALKDRVKLALLKQAATRAAAITDQSDQRERIVCREIIDGTLVDPYVSMVLIIMDMSGTFTTATDPQIDTAITTANTGAWNYIVKSRT